jgi:cell division protein FtsB
LEIPQFAPGREEPAELEEIEPLVIYPVDSLEEPKLPAFEVEDEGGRRSILALLVAAVAGVLVGAGLMGLFRQSEVDALAARLATASRELQVHSQARQKLGALKKELDSVQDEIRLLERNDYPAGSIPQTLAAAAVLEYKTAEALLRQQIAALEGGARLAVVARATPPDPKLAEAVEGEMARLHARVETLRAEAQGLDEVPRSVVQTAVATEELNMAILNRNRLIARYGLSAPLPARGGTD